MFKAIFAGVTFGQASAKANTTAGGQTESTASADKNGYASITPVGSGDLSAHVSGDAGADLAIGTMEEPVGSDSGSPLSIAGGAIVTVVLVPSNTSVDGGPSYPGQLFFCDDNAGTVQPELPCSWLF